MKGKIEISQLLFGEFRVIGKNSNTFLASCIYGNVFYGEVNQGNTRLIAIQTL